MPWWQGHEAAGRFVPAVRRQREKNVHIFSLLFFSPEPHPSKRYPPHPHSIWVFSPQLSKSRNFLFAHRGLSPPWCQGDTVSIGHHSIHRNGRLHIWMDEKGKEERVELGISGKRSRRWTGRQNIPARLIPFVSLSSPRFFLLIGFLVDLS